MYDTGYKRFDLLFIVVDPPGVVQGQSSNTLPRKIKTGKVPTLHISQRLKQSTHYTVYRQNQNCCNSSPSTTTQLFELLHKKTYKIKIMAVT